MKKKDFFHLLVLQTEMPKRWRKRSAGVGRSEREWEWGQVQRKEERHDLYER